MLREKKDGPAFLSDLFYGLEEKGEKEWRNRILCGARQNPPSPDFVNSASCDCLLLFQKTLIGTHNTFRLPAKLVNNSSTYCYFFDDKGSLRDLAAESETHIE